MLRCELSDGLLLFLEISDVWDGFGWGAMIERFGGDGDLKSDRGEGTANENLREKLLLFRWPSPWLLEDDCDQRLGLPVYSPVLLLEFDSLFDGDAW